MNWKALWVAVKEPLRWLAIAIIPVILAYFEVIDTQWAVIIVAVIRIADKMLHDYGKEDKNEIMEKGVVGF